jgi:rhamnose transport system permease protein
MLTLGKRERAVAAAVVALAALLAFEAPQFFNAGNLNDVFLANVPVLLIALGMTLLIVSGEIDISIGSAFAVCSIAAGMLAKLHLPLPAVVFATCCAGAALGAVNGAFTAYMRVPSIVVTLAMMIGLREALRWMTQGAWVQDLPANFQWLGFSQQSYPAVVGAIAIALFVLFAWIAQNTVIGRAIFATGSNAGAARLAGIDVRTTKMSAFLGVGVLTALAAVINSARFGQIPANSGLGLEMKVIAAVVIGGASVTGGRATMTGTVLGVVLLVAMGPALVYLGVSAYWERAAQGAIILTAVAIDAFSDRAHEYAAHVLRARAAERA